MLKPTQSENVLVERMFQLSSAYLDARAVWIMAKLNIADLLANGPRAVVDLATATSVLADPLHRMMRLAASNGVFTEVEAGRFALTPLGELLRSDSPNSMRDWVLWSGGPLHDCFRDALHSVQTGEPTFQRVHGVRIYEYLREHADDARNLGGAMVAYSREVLGALMSSFDFSQMQRLVDVGAGPGTIDVTVLRANPHMTATLFDLPHVVDQAHRPLAEAGVADRCTLVGGDFFKSVPEGGDVYVLSAVLHNWTDEECVTILKNCRRAFKRGKLLLLEMLMPTTDTPHFVKKSDVVMLVAVGGFERTLASYSELLEKSGFRLVKAHPSPGLICLVEAEPI